MADRGLQPTTRQKYFRELRTLMAFAMDEGVLEQSPMARLRPPTAAKRKPKPFTLAQVHDLWLAAQVSSEPLRNGLIIRFGYNTGVRKDELCALNVQDADLAAMTCHVLGKGKKERVLSIHPTTVGLIQEYIAARPRDPTDPLFVSATGRRLTPSGVYRLYRRLGVGAGIKGPCFPHMMRHAFGIESLRAGVDLAWLSAAMGHEDIRTTAIYLDVLNEDVIAEYERRPLVERLLALG